VSGGNEAAVGGEVSDRSKQTPKLTPADRRQLCRELATGEVRRAALARRYGVTTGYISKFAGERSREIKAIQDKLDDAFAGLWVASKEARLAALQAMYEESEQGEYGGHFEQIRTRTMILRQVAEELGALPNRSSAMIITPVVHIIQGDVDLDALK
jgi:hypothetical protein